MNSSDPVEPSFATHLLDTNLSGVRLGYGLGAVLMPAGVLLDWVTHPENALPFFWIRLGTAAASLVLLGACYLPMARRHTVAFGAGPPLLCAAGIEAMILNLDGYASSYYAGLNLCILAVGVLYVWHWRHALGVCGAIIGMWLAPSASAVLSGRIELAPFFNNLYFLCLTTMISVASTVIRYRLAKREFEASTKQRRASTELAQTLEQLRQLDRFKSQFFANITHELKTPLAMILAPLELMLDPDHRTPTEVQRSTLHAMFRSGIKLLKLIADLLDLSKLEESHLRLRVDDHDLVAYLSGLLAQIRPLAQRKAIELHFASNVGSVVAPCDLERIERVFINLLSNATKFTPSKGNIWLDVLDLGDRVRVSVKDDGVGFPADMAGRVFERFFQVDMAGTRKHGGTGIGLALAKELVELHGGKIFAEGSPGCGATFTVELFKDQEHFPDNVIDRRARPRDLVDGKREADRGLHEWTTQLAAREDFRLLEIEEATEQRVVDRDADERDRPHTILVVEDTPDIIRVIHLALHDHFRIFAAGDGKKGLELAIRELPNLIISDLMMPEIDGLELTRRLRASSKTRHIPIIMLTARADLEDRVAGLDTGVNAYLTKPFSPRELLSTVRSLLGTQETTADLVLTQKMDSLEVVAAALAHEINNPLNYVKNAIALVAEYTQELARLAKERQGGDGHTPAEVEARVRKLLDVAESGIKRIGATVDLMRRYSREGFSRALQPYDMFAAATDVVNLILPALGRDIRVETSFDGDGTAECVPEEINQVLAGLLENAMQVVADVAGGFVRVRGRRENDLVVISVADNGSGIKPEDRAKVFTPFFTTKGPGGGMGMGLAIARRVVTSLGGTISVKSQVGPGSGTEFTVKIPPTQMRDKKKVSRAAHQPRDSSLA